MIPKTIHYCWFGGKPLPELACKCIESWKKYCPDYQIVRWDETNFDVGSFVYTREAYDAKKWAFVTDVVRLYALVNYGGIYMDTDVEVLKSLEPILQYKAVSGFESDTKIPTGLIAAEKGHPLFCELLSEYRNVHFLKDDGSYDMTTNVVRITNNCLKYGLVGNNSFQVVADFALFPKDYFCAKDCGTKELNITENTYTVHHFDGSWHTPKEKFVFEKTARLSKKIPKKWAHRIARIESLFKRWQ